MTTAADPLSGLETVPAIARPAAPRMRRQVRGAYTVWQRELILFSRNRVRAVTSLMQPILYLLVFGTGLAATIRGAAVAGDYRIFLLPGVVIMTTLFSSMFAAVSIVWDREFGFLKEILVAPVSRTSVILGKTAGGATTSSMQALAILAFAPVVGLDLSLSGVIAVIPVLIVFSLAVSGIGSLFAAKVATMQGFMVVMNFVTMPLFFLSGALFPLDERTPAWLRALAFVDPATYAVDAMRRLLLPVAPPPVRWGGWALPIPFEVALLGAFAAVMLVLTVRAFDRAQ